MDTNFVSSDMIRGHIDTIILLSLSDEDKHSNEIREEIEKKAGGKYQVKQGTFYSALQRLAKQGFVTEYRSSAKDSIRRKYFHLTDKGKNFVEDNVSQWNYSKSVINNMIFNEDKNEQVKTKPIVVNEIETEFERLLQENVSDYEINQQPDDLNEYFESLNENLKSVTPPPVYNYEENLVSDYEENVDDNLDAQNEENDGEFANITTETEEKGDKSSENAEITEIKGFNDNHEQKLAENENSLNGEISSDSEALSAENEPEKYYVYDNYDSSNYVYRNNEETVEKENFFNEESLNGNENSDINAENSLQGDKNEIVSNENDENSRENSYYNENYNLLKTTPLARDVSFDGDVNVDDTVEQVVEVKNEELNDKLLDNEFNDDKNVSIDEKTDKIDSSRDVFNLELEVRQRSDNPIIDENQETEVKEKTEKEEMPDNTYVNSDEILFGKNEEKEVYDSLLEKLFPKKTTVFSDVTPTERTFEAKKDIIEENSYANVENEFDKLIKEQPLKENENLIDNEKKETVFSPLKNSSKNVDKFTYSYPTAKNEKFDYTDIIKLARAEGFKVRASNAVTHVDKDQKIFINKLNFHTSLLFFASFILQLFVLFLTIKFNQGFNAWFYITSLLLCACVPITFLVLYLNNKNKTVSNINKFRDSIEIVFIIALNLILLICAIAIISDINFSSGKDLLRYLIIPIVYVLNIPLFFIFKYVLLEKNGYIK